MVDFETAKTRSQLKKQVKNDWALWRLVLAEGRGFDYSTVFGTSIMTPQDIEMANIALDMQIEAEKAAMKRKT